jgi:hypothetical protein
VYIFSMSNEHNLVFSFILFSNRLWISAVEEVIVQILGNNVYSPQTKNKRLSKNNVAQKDK